MEDISLKDEALLSFIEQFKKKGWNPAIIEKQYREVKLFLFQFGIKDGGPNAVPGDVIYYKYLKTKHKNEAMSRIRFTQIIKTFLKYGISLNIPVFKIDATLVDLPKEYSFYKDPRFMHRHGRKSRWTGVTAAPFGEWMSQLEYGGHTWLIGFFKTSLQAAKAYNYAVIYYGLEKTHKLNKIKGSRNTYAQKETKSITDLRAQIRKDKEKERKARKMGKLKRSTSSVESS